MALTLNVKGYLKIVFHREDFFINHYPHSYTLFQHLSCVQCFFVDNNVILVVNGLYKELYRILSFLFWFFEINMF